MIFWFSWVPALYPLFLRLCRHGKAKLSSRLPLPMLETKLHANCLMLREGPHLYSTPRSCVRRQRSARPGQPRGGQSLGRGKAKSFAVLLGVGRSQEPSCPHWGKELAGSKAFWKSAVRGTAAWHCGCRCLFVSPAGFSSHRSAESTAWRRQLPDPEGAQSWMYRVWVKCQTTLLCLWGHF